MRLFCKNLELIEIKDMVGRSDVGVDVGFIKVELKHGRIVE